MEYDKYEICKNWELSGRCKYGKNCNFAHGDKEINIERSIFYRTRKCMNFWTAGYCPYGRRCKFMHNKKGKLTNFQGLLKIGAIVNKQNSRLYTWKERKERKGIIGI